MCYLCAASIFVCLSLRFYSCFCFSFGGWWQRLRRGRIPVEHRGTFVGPSFHLSGLSDLKPARSGQKYFLSGQKSALLGLKSAFSGLKSALSGLESALSGLKFTLSGLKSALSGLKSERADLQAG